jgi:hypothetical protein
MANDSRFRKKLSEEDILSLSEDQIQKIERINKSTEAMEEAEAKKNLNKN